MTSHLITYNQEIMKEKKKKQHFATMTYNIREFSTHGNKTGFQHIHQYILPQYKVLNTFTRLCHWHYM